MVELSYSLDFFTPDDAPGVVLLFRAVYGESFPVRTVYDPDELIRQDKAGEAYRMIARSPVGEVVGHISLFRSTPSNHSLYEVGCLMVRNDYRQTKLSFSLFDTLFTHLIKRYQITQIWGEAVCNHLFSQQEAHRLGLFETALEMDLMPAAAYTTPGAQSVGGRVSTLTAFILLKTDPQTIYLPPGYHEFIRELYAPLNLDRTVHVSDPGLLPSGATRGEIQAYTEAGLARITLDAIGRDYTDWIDDTINRAEQEGAVVMQVIMKLTCSHSAWAVKHLNARGFFIGGILPVWLGDDGLLMQKIVGTPFFEGTHVYSRRAKMIKEVVLNDWKNRCNR